MALFDAFKIASTGVAAQARRLNTVASNLANAESAAKPGESPYRARQVVFEAQPVSDAHDATGVQVTRVVESNAPARRVHDPAHPMADADGFVTLPNVNVVDEVVDMISASRAYQNNVEVMNTAKALMLKTLTLGS